VHVGLNLNNRQALIAPDYDLPRLLDLAERAEGLGFDSVWVGDSLLSKPRYEPLALLGALSQRTSRVRVGTACLVTTLRNPVQLAHAWSTLDVLSGGRTVLGACAGNVAEDAVKREFAVLGLDHRVRMNVFEEGVRILRALMTEGRTTYAGEHFALDDGWLTCCRASHPEEVERFLEQVATLRSLDGFDVAYQVTTTLAETREAALDEQRRYIDAYYPGFSDSVDLADWGPTGTADDVAAWMRRFAAAGVTAFVCRFAALDQHAQVERFARDVLPAVRP
jgi:alkanesulfonate monooxygenase SsuD/methylene tetrahydromethanopterin reductase-like flavin-dependent oxidoreductase (luciferase family)